MSSHRSSNDGAVPALEAFQRAFRVTPVASRPWRSASLNVWNTDRLEEYEVAPMDEPMIALHTGGVRGVRTRIGGRWSDRPSLPGQLYWIPAHHPSAWKVHGRLEFVSVHFRRAALERLAENVGVRAEEAAVLPFRAGFDDPFAAAACAALAGELASPGERGSLYPDLVADTLALHILRNARRRTSGHAGEGALAPHVARRVRERIEESLQCGVSLDELAREAGLSRFHFARSFKATTGLSPHRYLTSRRIERAKHLLAFTELAIAEIALEVGFASQPHFTERFRRATGRTPLEFRRGR
jgi:AraC family transcriptional regulator